MGECSDILNALLEAFNSGVTILDVNKNPITPTLESGAINQILAQLNKLDFDDTTKELSVKATINPGDFEIGAMEIKDTVTDVRAEVVQDNGRGAMFVQSNSLLKTTDFQAAVTNLINAVGASDTNIASIKAQTDKLIFNNGLLASISKLQDSSGTTINPATKEGVVDVKTSIDSIKTAMSISNTIVFQNGLNFPAGTAVGTFVTLEVPSPSTVKKNYVMSFLNKSIQTDVQIQLYLKESFVGGETVYSKYGESFTVKMGPDTGNPSGATSSGTITELVEGAFLAQGLAISAKSVDGNSNAFDLKITIREE